MNAPDLKHWDAELSLVAAEIERLASTHGRAALTGDKALLAKKVGVIQTQMNLERTLERIRKLTQRDFMLLPRERAMVHWAALFLDAAGRRLQAQAKHATRALWLKLVQARIAGPSSTMEGEQDDLVSLATRQANLAKTESYLADALVNLRRRKAVLTRRYQALGVVDANHEASGSLGTRLGATPQDALEGATMRSLEDYFRLMTAPVTAKAETTRLDAVAASAKRKSDGLMSLCRTLVIAKLREPAREPKPRVLDKFQAALQQLDDLEEETREAYNRILGAPSAPPKPLFVQNPGGHAKRDAT